MRKRFLAALIVFLCLPVCCSCRLHEKPLPDLIEVSWNDPTYEYLPSGERFESESFDYEGYTYVEIPMDDFSLDCWSIDRSKLTRAGVMKIWSSNIAKPMLGFYNIEKVYVLQNGADDGPEVMYCLAHTWIRSDIPLVSPREARPEVFQVFTGVAEMTTGELGSIHEEASLSDIVVQGSEKNKTVPFPALEKRYILRFYCPGLECLYTEVYVIAESDGSLWCVINSDANKETVMRVNDKWTGLINGVVSGQSGK